MRKIEIKEHYQDFLLNWKYGFAIKWDEKDCVKQNWEGKQKTSFELVTFEVSIKYSNRVFIRQLDTGAKF